MRNAGARIIANGLPHRIRIVDLENESRHIEVPSREARMWDGTIYPWCDNDTEVVNKAFKVTNADTGHVVYDLRLSVADSAAGGSELAPQSYVDIFIMTAHVWAWRRRMTSAARSIC